MKKRIIIKDDIIYNEVGDIIGKMSVDASLEDKRAIELGTELIPIAAEFVEHIKAGNLRAKYTFSKFEQVFERHPKIGV